MLKKLWFPFDLKLQNVTFRCFFFFNPTYVSNNMIIIIVTTCKESHVWQPRVKNVFQDSIGGTWPFLSRKQKHTTKKRKVIDWLKVIFSQKILYKGEHFTLMSWIARNRCTLDFDVIKCFLLYINYLIVALAELKKCWRISAIVSYVHLKNFRGHMITLNIFR